MVDKTRQTPQTEVDKMEETITRDLQGLVAALYAEADMCELLEITKPAALLREAAAVIQPGANLQTMDMFAEVVNAGHLGISPILKGNGQKTENPPVLQRLIDSIEVVAGEACWDYSAMYEVRDAVTGVIHSMRMSLHHQADEWEDHEELNGALAAAALRKIAGDEKPHRKLPILPPDDAQADRVRRIEENGPYPGMSIAFERHVGVECAWTDPEHAQEASMWAAAWKAAVRHAADEPVRDVFGNRWPA